jgi:hypothetical protein
MSPILGSFASGRSFGRSGGAVQVVATGGSSTYDQDGYRYHIFTGSNTFTVTSNSANTPLEILMVGGGGASTTYAGGAGGGEVLTISRVIGSGSYPLVIGSGGTANGPRDSSGPSGGRVGVATTGFGETAKPGGAGINSDEGNPGSPYSPVGCGGAGSSRTAGYFGVQGTSVGTGVTRYGGTRGGQLGGGNDAPYYPGGGGGGAGESRTTSTGGSGTGQPGGNGVLIPGVGLGYYWGGGGGGQVYFSGRVAGNGGLGGGGGGGAGSGNGSGGGSAYNPGSPGNPAGGPGGANTGGGGGGGRGETGSVGGNGGSGMIVIRYPYQA